MDDDAPPGVPEWVVTYGDMMSLLLTFFIMLVSLSEVVAEKKYRAILEALQEYGAYAGGAPAPPGKNFPANSLVEKLETLGSYTNEEDGRGGVKRPGVEGDSLRVKRTREGTPLQVGEPILFEPGESTIAPSEENKILLIALELAGKPNKISIRGHVGSPPTPYGSEPQDESVEEFRKKMILSYKRARAVWAVLRREGIDKDRMRLTAVGDAEPGEPSADQTANHPNRVEVIILDAFTSEFVGPQDPQTP
ncbi:MAG: OmpA family protein [Planctomycetaceae bacterium]|nr:OmpA family protein [Planctomycetaceae bacterium]